MLTFRLLIHDLTLSVKGQMVRILFSHNYSIYRYDSQAANQSMNGHASVPIHFISKTGQHSLLMPGLPHIQTQSGRYIFKYQNEGRHQYPQPYRDWERKEMSEWVVG